MLKDEPNELKKKTLFTAYLFTKLAKQEVDCYLVGGEAVELYTGGQFATGDIDITVTDRPRAEKLLLRLGFVRAGMIWLNEDLKIAVQIVASYPSRTEKIRTVKIGKFTLKVIGVEDLIIDRLVAAKYWRSNPKLDTEQATVLLGAFRNSLDLEYLERRAFEEKVSDFLRQIS